jgi:hypothetical protein
MPSDPDDYQPLSPAEVGRVARLVLFSEIRRLAACGHLTRSGLMHYRARLDTGEFEPGPDRDLVALEVADALAVEAGVSPDDMPGYPAVVPEPGDF